MTAEDLQAAGALHNNHIVSQKEKKRKKNITQLSSWEAGGHVRFGEILEIFTGDLNVVPAPHKGKKNVKTSVYRPPTFFF